MSEPLIEVRGLHKSWIGRRTEGVFCQAKSQLSFVFWQKFASEDGIGWGRCK